MRLDANPYAESQGLGSPLMRPPYVDGKIRPPPPMAAHMPSSTTSPTPTGVVVAGACSVLAKCGCGFRTARRDDVPTALRQNPAAKDHPRLAREALMQLWTKPAGKQGPAQQRSRDQRPRRCCLVTTHSSLHEPSISKPPPRAPRQAHSTAEQRLHQNKWPRTASDDEYRRSSSPPQRP